jgi:hypothetical protein
MLSPAVLAVLAAVAALFPVFAVAQDASVRDPDTRLRMETTRKRLIVRPDPPVLQALGDAERVADALTARRLAGDAGARVRAPQLDHDVTSAIQSRNLQRTLRR